MLSSARIQHSWLHLTSVLKEPFPTWLPSPHEEKCSLIVPANDGPFLSSPKESAYVYRQLRLGVNSMASLRIVVVLVLRKVSNLAPQKVTQRLFHHLSTYF